MNCSLPNSSVHGILQARMLEWVAFPFSRGSSWPRDRTQVFRNTGRFFTVWATWEGLVHGKPGQICSESVSVIFHLLSCIQINFLLSGIYPKEAFCWKVLRHDSKQNQAKQEAEVKVANPSTLLVPISPFGAPVFSVRPGEMSLLGTQNLFPRTNHKKAVYIRLSLPRIIYIKCIT